VQQLQGRVLLYGSSPEEALAGAQASVQQKTVEKLGASESCAVVSSHIY
jgi:hypothetical protein